MNRLDDYLLVYFGVVGCVVGSARSAIPLHRRSGGLHSAASAPYLLGAYVDAFIARVVVSVVIAAVVIVVVVVVVCVIYPCRLNRSRWSVVAVHLEHP